ncbi:Hsp20/alpha crystallin family protein [Hydrogenophilus islandicus]|jgi:HSP20 family protein
MIGLLRFPTALFDEFERLQREIDRAFAGWPLSLREAGGVPLFPAVNVGRTADAIYVYLFAPGIDPSKLEVTLEQGVLTVAGERGPWQVSDKQTVYAQERFAGKFKRTLTLPDEIDPDQVEAKYQDGIVTIRIGRKAHLMPRRIEVQ